MTGGFLRQKLPPCRRLRPFGPSARQGSRRAAATRISKPEARSWRAKSTKTKRQAKFGEKMWPSLEDHKMHQMTQSLEVKDWDKALWSLEV